MTETPVVYDLRVIMTQVREYLRQYDEREKRIQGIYARGNVVRVGTEEELETYDTDIDSVWGNADSALIEAHDLFDRDPHPLPVPVRLWHTLLIWGETEEGQEWMASHL